MSTLRTPTINGQNVRDLSDVSLAFHMNDVLTSIEIWDAEWKSHLIQNPNARLETAFPHLAKYYEERDIIRTEMHRRKKLNAPKCSEVLLEVHTILKDGLSQDHELYNRIPWARIKAALAAA